MWLEFMMIMIVGCMVWVIDYFLDYENGGGFFERVEDISLGKVIYMGWGG